MALSKLVHCHVRGAMAAAVLSPCATNALAQVPPNCRQWIVTMFASFQPVQGRTPPKVPTQAQCDASRDTLKTYLLSQNGAVKDWYRRNFQLQ